MSAWPDSFFFNFTVDLLFLSWAELTVGSPRILKGGGLKS